MAHAQQAPREQAAGDWLSEFVPPAAAAALLALAFSYCMPLGYGPDEPRHFNCIRLLAAQHKLPRVLPDGTELGGAIALHPPLYYAVEALLWYPASAAANALGPALAREPLRTLITGADPAGIPDSLLPRAFLYRIFRLTSPLWGLATLALFYAALRRAFPATRPLRALPLWLVAVWPHWLLNHAAINNDNAANLAGALFVWFWIVRGMSAPRGWRRGAEAGLVAAVGALAKSQLLLCLAPMSLLGLAWPHGRRFAQSGSFWREVGAFCLVLAALAGPWYARNLALYGQLVYTPPGYCLIPPGLTFFDALLAGIIPRLLARTLWGLFISIPCQVGWIPQPADLLFYTAWGALVALALVGWLAGRWRAPLAQSAQAGLAVVLLAYPLLFAINVYAAIFVHFGTHQGGRYHMFLLPAIVLILLLGWVRLVGTSRARRVGVAATVAFLMADMVSAANILLILNPTYATSVAIMQ